MQMHDDLKPNTPYIKGEGLIIGKDFMSSVNDASILKAGNNIKKLSEEELRSLWALFFADKKNEKTRERLIVQHIYLVKYVVGRIRMSLPPSIATDDIASYGVEGLINAIDKFEPDKGAKFETYALTRIKGNIIDKIRSQDWIPRSAKRKFKEIKNIINTLQMEKGIMPTVEEIAEKLEMPVEKVQALLVQMDNNKVISIYDQKGSSSESMEIIDTIQDEKEQGHLENLEEKDAKKELSNAISKLPERERMLLALYYHENMTLKEIGEAMGISESRTCQLHAQSIMKLRKILTAAKNQNLSRKSIV